MKYLESIAKAYEREICLLKNLYKSCIITDFCKHQRIHYCKGAINFALSNPFFVLRILGLHCRAMKNKNANDSIQKD